MKNSLIILGLFFAGMAIGQSGIIPTEWPVGILPRIILYILVIQVGLSLGRDGIAVLKKEMKPSILLVPFCTVAGTLVFTAIASLAISRWSLSECLAVGCGFGYYSLSSVLISDIKQATLGVDGAAALGAVALLTNIARELMALAGAPLFAKYLGKLAPVTAAGVTSMDSSLPVIKKFAGTGAVPAALVNGVVLEIATPLLVTFFCSI